MTALQDRRARLLAALYDQFGEPATWQLAAGGAAISCTVRRRGDDVLTQYGPDAVLQDVVFLKVRKSEVAAPAKRDLVTIGTETFRINSAPRKAKAAMEWICEAKAV